MAAEEAAALGRGGKGPLIGMEVAVLVFLFFGQGIKIPVTPEAKKSLEKAVLHTRGIGDWPEPSLGPWCKPRKNELIWMVCE